MRLADGYSTKRVYGAGPQPCDVMILGEAPGSKEDESGIPFYGPAGAILNKGLKEAGLSRNDVFITNCIPFRPPNNRTPRVEEFQKVSKYLIEDFRSTRPKFVLLLGRTPLTFLTRLLPSVGSNRGWLNPKDVAFPFNVRTFLTYHPAYFLYNPKELPIFTEDLKKFAEVILSDANPEGETDLN